MYESELAPEPYKETARQNPRATPVIPDNHVLPSAIDSDANNKPKDSSTPAPIKTKTITETMTEKLAPAYSTVAEATQNIASKIPGLTVLSTPPATASGEQQVFDKGVSVKEYLMNKLEPGEDERALSQVISAAMSPKKAPGEMGVVDKVKEAVTMLLGNGESTSPSSTATSPKSNSALVPIVSNTQSQIPISTNAYEGWFFLILHLFLL